MGSTQMNGSQSTYPLAIIGVDLISLLKKFLQNLEKGRYLGYDLGRGSHRGHLDQWFSTIALCGEGRSSNLFPAKHFF